MVTRTVDQIDGYKAKKLEWLLTNGLGGYSSTTLGGGLSRKYHGLLIAALPAPHGRTNMLNFIEDALVFADEKEIPLSSLYRLSDATSDEPFNPHFVQFRLENGLPIWKFQVGNCMIEKRILLVHMQNTVHIQYTLLSGDPCEIKMRPYLQFRGHEAKVDLPNNLQDYSVLSKNNLFEISHLNFPPLRLCLEDHDAQFNYDNHVLDDVFYRVELKRGYHSKGTLVSLGYFKAKLLPNVPVNLIASTESWETILLLNTEEAFKAEHTRRHNLQEQAEQIDPESNCPLKSELILAADQFVVVPYTRLKDLISLHAEGEEIKSIIAGYPWFTDWGRDTMISLEGLTLVTGRWKEAEVILRTFAHYIHLGLLPNMFPEGENEGIYNTADATLWFFHAIERYYHYTKNKELLHFITPHLIDIFQHHIQGTLFGIKVAEDGLLTQGQEGYQLTWMDAKVEEWVVTPRYGKPVEINALWYNALRILQEILKEIEWKTPVDALEHYADLCYHSFNKRFWFAEGNYLYDVIDCPDGTNDPACRPNQLFAISLKYAVLDPSRWETIVKLAKEELLTPVGLRSLSPKHPEYKQRYDGDLRSRDAAYHQGTVWPWLLGAFISAWLKVYPTDKEEVKKIIQGLQAHMQDICIGTLGEIFDAEPPYKARGCFAQAWSVSECLKCLSLIKK